MNYYQDITLLPDADIGLYFLWQKVYQQIHLALVENKIADNASPTVEGQVIGSPSNRRLRKFFRNGVK